MLTTIYNGTKSENGSMTDYYDYAVVDGDEFFMEEFSYMLKGKTYIPSFSDRVNVVLNFTTMYITLILLPYVQGKK